jgi:hypothetical protein
MEAGTNTPARHGSCGSAGVRRDRSAYRCAGSCASIDGIERGVRRLGVLQ